MKKMGWRIRSFSIFCLVSVAPMACSTGSVMQHAALRGEWGGEHIRLFAGDSLVTIEFDCAHATIEGGLRLDAEGRFEAVGWFVSESGAIREGDGPRKRQMVFKGRAEGSVMFLQVGSTGNDGESFELRMNEAGRLFKCQ